MSPSGEPSVSTIREREIPVSGNQPSLSVSIQASLGDNGQIAVIGVQADEHARVSITGAKVTGHLIYCLSEMISG